MKEQFIKAFALVNVIILVLSLTLAALGIMTWRLFWMIAILTAIVAYYVIPALKKKSSAGDSSE